MKEKMAALSFGVIAFIVGYVDRQKRCRREIADSVRSDVVTKDGISFLPFGLIILEAVKRM